MPSRPPTQTPSQPARTVRHRRLAALCVASLAVGLPVTLMGAAGTATAGAAGKAKVDVKAAARPSVGTILVTSKGAALYRDTDDGPNHPTCTGACAAEWPPLLLPAGQTAPVGGPGVTGLGRVKVGKGTFQITFDKEPLYTFVEDSGTSVKGNGLGPFEVVPAP